MKIVVVFILLMASCAPVFAQYVDATFPQTQANKAACFKIMQELKEIKFLRDQQMDTGGPKNLLEIEREWQGKYRASGCSIWQSDFDRR